MTFGHLIKSVRESQGMTQEELAEQVYISLKAVQSWEQEWRLPRLPMIPKIARALRMPTERLLQFVVLPAEKRVG